MLNCPSSPETRGYWSSWQTAAILLCILLPVMNESALSMMTEHHSEKQLNGCLSHQFKKQVNKALSRHPLEADSFLKTLLAQLP